MLNEYPKFKRGEVESEVYDKLPEVEREHIQEYLTYREARGIHLKDKLNDVRRYLLHIRFILGKPVQDIDLKEFRQLLALINNSRLSNNVKNHIKTDLRNFLKYSHDDWSRRYKEFDDVVLDSSKNEEKINSKTIFTQEEVDKMIKHETHLFWKAFLLTQHEGGLRTIEARSIKWSDIKFNFKGEVSKINIFSTKTKKARAVFVEKATHYLKMLKEEQENLNDKGIYVFHAKSNKDMPVLKSTTNEWFRNLTKRVLGRQGWNYLLRHSKATELYRLADEGKISEPIVSRFMGHNKSMKGTYAHIDDKDIEEMIASQVYHIEDLPPKKKHKLESKIEELQSIIKREIPQLQNALMLLSKNNPELKQLMTKIQE